MEVWGSGSPGMRSAHGLLKTHIAESLGMPLGIHSGICWLPGPRIPLPSSGVDLWLILIRVQIGGFYINY